MRLDKNRYLQELMCLLGSKEPVTSGQLAGLTSCSIRTVKNDIVFLNGALRQEQVGSIQSLKARGYLFCPEDDSRLSALKTELMVWQSVCYNRPIVETNRILFVEQMLLSNDAVKKEDLCEKLFISESTISPILQEVSSFLQSYGLRIASLPGVGLKVAGREQDQRSCMVEIACSFYHDVTLLYPVEKFDHMFYESRSDYEDVRHALLKILRDSRISVSDIFSKKLATHLVLIKRRAADGRHPVFDETMIREIKDTYEFELAQAIFCDPVIYSYIGPQEEIEMVNYARLLIIARDIDLRHTNDVETLNSTYVIQAGKLTDHVIDMLRDGVFGSFFDMEIFRLYERDYESIVLQLYLKHHFDLTGKIRFVTYVEADTDYLSPFAKEMVRQMLACLQQIFHERIESGEIQMLAVLTDYIYKQVRYPYHKLRLATSCMEGKVAGNLIKENLQDHFGQYIAYNDVFDLYEMRKVNFANYDHLVLSSSNPLYYSYPLKRIVYQGLSTKGGRKELFREMFCDGYEKTVVEKLCRMTRIFPDADVPDADTMMKMLTFKYGRSDQDQKKLEESLETRRQISSYCYNSQTAVVMLDYPYVGRELLDIYVPKQSLYCHGTVEMKYLIAVCLKPGMKVSDLKQVNRMIQNASQDASLMQKLVSDPAETWHQIWFEIVENSFVNGI